MSNGKTVLQWLQDLPEPYKTQAIENATEFFTLEKVSNSLPKAIEAAFLWSDTRHKESKDNHFQGHNYWESVFTRAENGEFDKTEIPFTFRGRMDKCSFSCSCTIYK